MSETTVNVGKATSGGYRPLSLTLKGFKGIRSGLGRDAITLDLEALVGDDQLVAIAGDASGCHMVTANAGSCDLSAVGYAVMAVAGHEQRRRAAQQAIRTM